MRIAREVVSDIKALVGRASELERELLLLIRDYTSALLAETGCGTIPAATVIGRAAVQFRPGRGGWRCLEALWDPGLAPGLAVGERA